MPSTVRPWRAWKRRTARFDIGIEDVGDAGVGVEIAGRDQPLAQRHDARMAVAEPQPVDRAAPRPAAARDDAVVARDRLLGASARSPATASAATPSASGWCARRNRSPGRIAALGLIDQRSCSVVSWARAPCAPERCRRQPQRCRRKCPPADAASSEIARLRSSRLPDPEPCPEPGNAYQATADKARLHARCRTGSGLRWAIL